MRYEVKIGWRYLYSGKADRVMVLLALVSIAISVVGLGILLAAPGNSVGVLMFVAGLVLTAVFALMSVFTVFTSVSVLGVAFGVAALTVVLAVTTGFQKQFRDKVLGVNAHVIVLKSQNTFGEYRDVMKTAQSIDPDVLSVQPFIFAEMLVTRGKGQLSGVAIKGVDPKLVGGVLDLDQHIILCEPQYRDETGKCVNAVHSLAESKPGQVPPIIMGRELAHKLKAQVGNDVTVVVPLSNIDFDTWRAKSSAPRTRKFRVTAIFYSGFDEYDRRLMYTSLQDTQDLVGRGDQVMGVELKVKDVDRAPAIAEKLGRALGGPPYQVQDWYDLNHNLFTALNLQKLALVFILALIMLVAAVNMVSALTMMVTDKTREIAILKSMGSTSTSVATVFQVVGATIGGLGTLIGLIVGLSTCAVMSSYGYALDPKVYLIDRLPIEVRWIEVVFVIVGTMLVSVIATLVPSGSASSLRPVDGLRYD
ncbi:MAG: ABC transporter permease [Deltaproteobacteria bacterium]|nr:ABC transporter permease [Deltaproteobacteria bacterium]MCW5803326.1 ABC transporter permease [Deltaproteobacteria bacterium]